MNFVVFDKDGNPLRDGVCPDGQEQAQAKEGETAFAWPANKGSPLKWRVVDGELVAK